MYYTYAHPLTVDFMPQEEYNGHYAYVLDGLGITEMTVHDFKQMDIPVKKERISQLLSTLSLEMTREKQDELVDFLYDDIFANLDGANFPDNQTGFTPLRSCSGRLQAVVEDYRAKNPGVSLTDLSVIGTMDTRDFEYIRTSLTDLISLDLSDAIPVGPDKSDYYVIPERALYREDGLMKLDLVNLHDSTLAIGADAFRNCQHLTFVFLSKELTEIGPSAFSDCPNLTKIVFPKTFRKLGEGAFSQCPKLKSVLCLGAEPASVETDSFTRYPDSRLVIPLGSKENYYESNWPLFFTNVFEDDTGDMDNYRKIREVRKNHIGFSHDEKMAIIRMMQAMSHSDNSPHYCEEVIIQDVGGKTFDLSNEEITAAKAMPIPDAIRILVRMSPEKKEDLMNKVQIVAEADGGYTPGEKELYQLLKNKL